MNHILDNPAWNALISGNKSLSQGNEFVKYFVPDVSPFAAMETNSADNLKLLLDLVPFQNPIGFISSFEIEIPAYWDLVRFIKCHQMVYNGTTISGTDKFNFLELTERHVPQMLALTKLTKPGPFAERTILFGQYSGIFENDELIAMAGHRLQPYNYIEISAVCTHPDHLGKGYAKELLKFHINKIIDMEKIPFLHVRHDNDRAINVYKQMGFKTRSEIYFYFIKKAD